MAVFRLFSVTILLIEMYSERRYWTCVSITASPPVELRLQQGDGVFQRLVPLLLLLPLALPLLSGQLHVQAHLVLHRLCPGGTQENSSGDVMCGRKTYAEKVRSRSSRSSGGREGGARVTGLALLILKRSEEQVRLPELHLLYLIVEKCL